MNTIMPVSGVASFVLRNGSLYWSRHHFGETMIKNARAFGIAALLALTCIQAGPALAYGPYNAFASRDSVSAMGYLRVTLGQSQAESRRAASFGFLVQRDLQFAHPAYQRGRWAYSDSPSRTFDLMDLGFGLDGKFLGFGADRFDALETKLTPVAVTNFSDSAQ